MSKLIKDNSAANSVEVKGSFNKVLKSLFPTWFGGKGSGPQPPPFIAESYLRKYYEMQTMTLNDKASRISDYEAMIKDTVMAAAVETVAEDAFLTDDGNSSIRPESKDKEILNNCNEFFDSQDIDSKIASWAYSTTFYGELPVRVEGEPKVGIVSLNDSIHPSDFIRIQSGSLFGFTTEYDKGVNKRTRVLPPWELVHMFYKRSPHKRKKEELRRIHVNGKDIYLEPFDAIGFLESVRGDYKKLKLTEDSLVLARLDRAPLKRVFFIDVGDCAPEQKMSVIEEFKRNYKSETSFDSSGKFTQSSNPLAYGQELFIPISEGLKGIDVEEYGGRTDVKGIVDVEYLQSKVFAGLKIPKSFLGYTEDLPGSLGESALVRLEIRYARVVKAARKGVMDGTFRLCQIHNAYKGIEVTRKNLRLNANYISTAEEEEIRSIFKSRMESTQDFISLLSSLGIEPDKFSPDFIKYVMFDLLKLTNFNLKLLKEAVREDPKVAQDMRAFIGDYIIERHPRPRNDEIYETILLEDHYLNRFKSTFGDCREIEILEPIKSTESKV